jgi:hypothetical protein
MKTLVAIFVLALSLSLTAVAGNVPKPSAYDCKGDPKCERGGGDGAALVSCAPVNGYAVSIPVSFDKNCSNCLKVACDQAKIDNEPEITVNGTAAAESDKKSEKEQNAERKRK